MFMTNFLNLRPLLFLFTILTLTGCGSGTKRIDDSLAISYSDMNIDHNDLILSNYFFKTKIIRGDSLWSFDIKTNTLALFDLEENKPLLNIEFSLDGPNFIGNQISDFTVNASSILILDLGYLSIFNFQGRIQKRIELKNIKGYSSLFRLDKMASLSETEVIISVAHLVGRVPGIPTPEATPIFIKVNLQTEAISFLEPSYPANALLADPSQGYWGITAPITLIHDNSRIIYSFSFSSDIYEFNLLTKNISVHKARTKLTENKKPPLAAEQYKNTRELAKFGLGGLNFKNVQYDSKNQRYFRLHSLVEYGDSAQEPVRNAFITILNSDFDVIHESSLNDQLIPYSLLNKGSLIIKRKKEVEGRYDLSLLTIKDSNR